MGICHLPSSVKIEDISGAGSLYQLPMQLMFLYPCFQGHTNVLKLQSCSNYSVKSFGNLQV